MQGECPDAFSRCQYVCVSSACEIESLHREWLVWTCYQYDCYDAVSVALACEIERLHGGMV